MDEIQNDDKSAGKKDEGGEMWKSLEQGTRKATPNLRNLPSEQKEKIAKEALAKAADFLMKTYISLGIGGEAVMGLHDGISGTNFRLSFKTE